MSVLPIIGNPPVGRTFLTVRYEKDGQKCPSYPSSAIRR